MKQALRLFGTAIIDLLTAIINALGSVFKNHPKFFGVIIAVAGFFLACMVSPVFMDFAAQVIALLIIGWVVVTIFSKKKEAPKPPSPPRRNNNRRRSN